MNCKSWSLSGNLGELAGLLQLNIEDGKQNFHLMIGVPLLKPLLNLCATENLHAVSEVQCHDSSLPLLWWSMHLLTMLGAFPTSGIHYKTCHQ